MNFESKKKLLLKYKLTPSDFYAIDDKAIIKRTGMDKLEKQIREKSPFEISMISITTTPYGQAVQTTVMGKVRLKDGAMAQAIAEANPDNCDFPFYASIAYKRLKHKLILMLLDLYELEVFSEEESNLFKEVRKNINDVTSEVNGALAKNVKNTLPHG